MPEDMGMMEMPMAPDEMTSDGTGEDERATLELAIEQFPVVGTIIERLMDAAAPPVESPEDTVKANLAPGEFVFTAEAVKNIGVDKLQSMMEKAEEKQATSQGGKVVEGQEQAFSNGGYVDDEGQRGFVEKMYRQGKETQDNYMHKESGFNYQDGGPIRSEREQYMKGQAGQSIWERLKGGLFGEEEAPAVPAVSLKEQAMQDPEVKEAYRYMQGHEGTKYFKDDFEFKLQRRIEELSR